jgi:hypothetical protein
MALYRFGGQVRETKDEINWTAVPVWPFVSAAPVGAWPENADFPLGYAERDAKL